MKLESQCCLKCKKRHMGCHADCADYLEAKAEHERLMKAEILRREANGYEAESARRRHK